MAILIPEYYNLGHVSMGVGNISALQALNMERINSQGVKYRDVMSNFLVEIERCIRLGIAFDLFWDMKDLDLSAYREIVHIREDGKVEVISSIDRAGTYRLRAATTDVAGRSSVVWKDIIVE